LTKIRKTEVKVDQSQFSLAIGKQGQNVRLASKLTGWKINIDQGEFMEVFDEEDENKEIEETTEGSIETKKATKTKKVPKVEKIKKVPKVPKVAKAAKVEEE
jgi:N utilization substance protein A